MATNKSIQLEIGAQDRFSRTLNYLEKRIAALSAPIKKFQNNMTRLDGFGPARLRRGLLGLSQSAVGAARSMGTIIPALGAITGAASIAGVYRLSSAWARFGQQLGITSHAMGVSPRRLQLLGNAARLAGGSAEGMHSALQDLSQTKFNIKAGLDPAALAQFQAFGISLRDIEKLSPDKLFERIATKLRTIRDPVAQAAAAQKLFGSGAQGVLPILQQNETAYRRNIDLAERYGVVNQSGIEAANRLAMSQSKLELAVQGFGYALAESLEPVIGPVITKMANWIQANKDWISTNIAEYVGKLVGWFQNGGWDRIVKWAETFYQKTDSIAQKIGGWKNVAIGAAAGIGLLFAAPVMAGLGSLLLTIIKIKRALTSVSTLERSAQGMAPSIGTSRRIGGVNKKLLAETMALGAYNLAKTGDLQQITQVGGTEKLMRHLTRNIFGGDLAIVNGQSLLERQLHNLFGNNTGHSRADQVISGLFKGDDAVPQVGNFLRDKLQGWTTDLDKTHLTDRGYNPSEQFNHREYASLRRKINAKDPRALSIHHELAQRGFSENAIAGVLANFSQESSFDPAANNGSHAGLAQWDRQRQAQFAQEYGHPLTSGSIPEQVDFFVKDLKRHKTAYNALNRATSPAEAAFALGRHYEIPGITDATLRPDVNARALAANDWAGTFHKKVPSSKSQEKQFSADDWAAAMGGSKQIPQRVEVAITHENAPAGSVVKIAKSTPGISLAGIKTTQAMQSNTPSL